MQSTPDRAVRPRCQITYDVESYGRLRKVELPFVVGVLADLSGHPKEPLRPLEDRKFRSIDRDSFDEVLSKAAPRLVLRVADRLSGQNSSLDVELHFEGLADFEPVGVAQQVRPLQVLLLARQRLTRGPNQGNPEDVADIDRKLSIQLAEIMHHADFQRLEATWRGLRYLVDQSETCETLKIRVLDVTKDEWLQDFEKASAFDESLLFQKVNDEEFCQRGGKPFGLLVGDYEFGRQDVQLLAWIAEVSAFAHAPFVAGASPKLFGLDNFTELTTNLNLAEIFDGVAYARWKSFRESEASRYVALTLPRVLARLPYDEKLKRTEAFKFEEFADGENNDKFLWMSAAWTYAARVTDAFAKYGWMQRTRGAHGGGKAEGLPVHTFPTDDGDIATKCPTEIATSDRRDFELSHVGFLPLLYNNDAEIACFVGASSCNKPQRYFDKAANACAERSAEFNLTLCRSRFVHYLKVMARDKIGSFLHMEHCGRWLTEWLADYRVDRNVESAFKPWDARADEASEAMLTQRPLAEGRVEVRQGAKTGCCEMVIWLGIHFGFRDYEPPIQLVAEIPKLRG